LIACLLVVVLPALAASARGDEPFYLKDGDRVVFYGDSITDQRLYTTYVETYVVTRFPKENITFVHSGWGGDRVGGGAGGRIDQRLKRDVFAYKPTVMTVMLGMNDASYRPYDEAIHETYVKGYEHIVDSVKSHVPGIRMTLIVPSPFDDVTRAPKFEGGYNAVLLRYGESVKELAKKEGVDVADLNTPVVKATEKAFASDPQLAEKLNPDRVHPKEGGQLLMAAALLNAWHAPAVVSAVEIEAGKEPKAKTEHSEISDLRSDDGRLSWTQTDERLPFPIDLKDPVVALAEQSSKLLRDLDRQPLKVNGLEKGKKYALLIDGHEIDTLAAEQLAEGVNLATRPTPMAEQARAVHKLTIKHTDFHQKRWREVQVPNENYAEEAIQKAVDGLDALEAEMVKEQRKTAQPKKHQYVLEPTG
jgi:lysophospholipase L1-like esterase